MLVWMHGLEGSPDGAKSQALRASGLPVVTPDGRECNQLRRVALVEAAMDRVAGLVVLGGSSYGGLTAAVVAMRRPERVAGLLLAAPALGWREPPVPDDGPLAPPGIPCVVIHGRQDSVVSIQGSRDYAARSGAHVRLYEVDDDHMLTASLALILEQAALLVRGV